PRKFASANAILEVFYQKRLEIYIKRKEYQIQELIKDIDEKKLKIRFYVHILTKELVIENQLIDNVYIAMDRLGLPYRLFDEARIRHLTQDGLQKLEEELRIIMDRLDNLKKTTVQTIWLNELSEFEEAYKI